MMFCARAPIGAATTNIAARAMRVNFDCIMRLFFGILFGIVALIGHPALASKRVLQLTTGPHGR